MLRQKLRAGVQPVANVVAVEQKAVHAQLMELVVHDVGHRALAAAAQSRKPHDAAAVPVQSLPLWSADVMLMPGNVHVIAHAVCFPFQRFLAVCQHRSIR